MKYAYWVIFAVCMVAYAGSLDGSFHYDDEHSIEKNLHIRDLGNVDDFFVDPAMFSWDPGKAMYRPVLLVSYALNYAWGEYEVTGYHVVNILIHGLNACLVWWLVVLLTERRDVALWAGLLFALHPICSEPVNYISSRSESLAALFYMVAMGLFVKGHARGNSVAVYASWGALALGLLTKSTVITLPAVVLVCDYLLISGRHWPTMRAAFPKRHLPYWAIALAYVLIIRGNEFLTRSLDHRVRDAWTQSLTQIKAFSYYIKLLLWPTDLNVEHQFFEQKDLGEPALIGAVLFLGSFLGLLYYLFRKRWELSLFLHLWGLLVLVPTMVIPLNVLVNERRIYLSCAAFCIGLALVLRSNWLQRRRFGAVDLGKILGAVIIVGYAGLIQMRNPVWKNESTLWQDSVAKSPLMPRSHLYLGNTYKDAALNADDSQAALEHWRQAAASYEQVMELKSDNELALRALNNLGGVYWHLGNLDVEPFTDLSEAEDAYRRAVKLNPNYADAWVNVASMVRTRALTQKDPEQQKKLLQEARDLYKKALQLAPNHAAAYANLGVIFHDLGEYENSKEAYRYTLLLNPRDAQSLKNMGNLFADLGQQDVRAGRDGRENLLQAQQHLRKAIQITVERQVRAQAEQSLKAVEQLLQMVQ